MKFLTKIRMAFYLTILFISSLIVDLFTNIENRALNKLAFYERKL